jgi:hypothetical protein
MGGRQRTTLFMGTGEEGKSRSSGEEEGRGRRKGKRR